MNRVSFGESACERTRKYLDSYISNELLVETNHEVLRHLEGCPACSAEVETRSQLRTRLRSAVHSQAVPPELTARIRETIRSGGSRPSFFAWARWPMAATAALAAGLALWVNVRPERLPDVADRPAQNSYIQRISSRMAAVLRVGLGDHLHCSVFRKKSAVPTVAEMEKQLGASYQGLLPVVSAAAPTGYRIVMAHHCSYLKRPFVHLTLENDGGSLLSLVIARKQDGESLAALVPEVVVNETPIYGSAAGRYQVSSFDAGNFLAYVVSDMSSKANRQVASAMAPGVRGILMKIAG